MQQNEANNLFESLKNNNVDNKTITDAVAKLSAEQKNSLDELLNNPEMLNRFINSPTAKSILNKLKND